MLFKKCTTFALCHSTTVVNKNLILTFGMYYNEPKVGIKHLLICYLLPESFVLASARILLLVSFLFVAVVNPFDSYSCTFNLIIFYHSSFQPSLNENI